MSRIQIARRDRAQLITSAKCLCLFVLTIGGGLKLIKTSDMSV